MSEVTQPKWQAENYAEAAAFFGISERALRLWTAETDWPLKRPGKGTRVTYDLGVICRWRFEKLKKEIELAAEPADVGSDELEKLRGVKRRIAELRLAELQDQLIYLSDAQSAQSAALAAFVAGVETTRDILSQRYPDDEPEIARRFDECMARVRERLEIKLSPERRAPGELEDET
jgi:hypothetical protein